MRDKQYISGRNNLALTIFVPWDCTHNCPFCTSKKSYKEFEGDSLRSLIALSLANQDGFINNEVRDIVFTGGEPFTSGKISSLDYYIRKVRASLVNVKNVFINTTLPKDSFDEVLSSLDLKKVNGINISRHKETYEEDCKMFQSATSEHGIVDDDDIKKLSARIPIRINCVLPMGKTNEGLKSFIKNVLNRWSGNNQIIVNFRADYRYITKESLYSEEDQFFECVKEMYDIEYLGHSQCNVCFTAHFNNYGDYLNGFNYHKGLQHSSLHHEDGSIEVNDLIMRQDGRMFHDWDMNGFTRYEFTATLPTTSSGFGSGGWIPMYNEEPSIPRPSCGGSGTSCGSSRPSSSSRPSYSGSCGGGSSC